jgi:hypothetical protein
VFDGLRNGFVSDGVDVLLPPRFFAFSGSKQGVVRGLGAALSRLPAVDDAFDWFDGASDGA